MTCETIEKIDPVMWIVAIVALCVVGGSIYLWCIKAKQRDQKMNFILIILYSFFLVCKRDVCYCCLSLGY